MSHCDGGGVFIDAAPRWLGDTLSRMIVEIHLWPIFSCGRAACGRCALHVGGPSSLDVAVFCWLGWGRRESCVPFALVVYALDEAGAIVVVVFWGSV